MGPTNVVTDVITDLTTDIPTLPYDAFLNFCKECIERNKKIYDKLSRLSQTSEVNSEESNKLEEAESRIKLFKKLMNTRKFFDKLIYKDEGDYFMIVRQSNIVVNIISAHAKSYGEFCIYVFPFLSSRLNDPKVIEDALTSVDMLDKTRINSFSILDPKPKFNNKPYNFDYDWKRY